MQTIYALVMCAMLHGQIVPDRCQVGVFSGVAQYPFYATAAQCEDARMRFLETFVFKGYSSQQIQDGEKTLGHQSRWKAGDTGFLSTVMCMKKQVPAWEPAQ